MKITMLAFLIAVPLAFCQALDKAFTPDADTLSLWVFDAGSGDKVANKTDPKVVGEFSGEPKWVKDDVGTGLEFNGEDAQLSVAKGGRFNIDADSPFTIDILVRVPKDAVRVGSIYYALPWLQIEYRNSVFTIWSSFTDVTAKKAIGLNGKMPVNDGLPHRITIVRDASKEKLIQYIDGKLDAEAPCPKSGTFIIPLDAAIGGEIQRQPNYTRRSENFQGVIYAIHISKGAKIPQ